MQPDLHSSFRLSEQQQAIVEAVASNDKDVMVKARAGCGKTTTILAACNVAHGDVAFFAFNKAIASELATKAPRHVKVQTMHSLGLSCLRSVYPGISIDADKTYALIRAQLQDGELGLISPVKRLVGLVKNVAPLEWEAITDRAIEELADSYGVELPDNHTHRGRVFGLVRRTLHNSIPAPGKPAVIDFDDMVWLPVALRVEAVPSFDWTFIDEAQDLNAVQMLLLLMVAKGRVCYVGDPAQAIYAFRGADSSAMATLKERLQSDGREVIELGLTKTRRCPQSIVRAAQAYVPDFEAMPEAPEGIVREARHDEVRATPGDMVVCRLNAPLIPQAYALLRAGVPCKVQGRDIGSGLIAVIKKVKPVSIDDLIRKVEVYHNKEANAAARRYEGKPSKFEAAMLALDDKCETLTMLASGQDNVDSLIAAIERLFGDVGNTKGVVLLSTIHKAKGLEADRVWWLQPAKSFEGEQEDNLRYVAMTRAKAELVTVQLPADPE